MDWGRTDTGMRRHVLAEALPASSHYVGISLCGLDLTWKFAPMDVCLEWPVCQNCETLLSAMESV